MLVIDWLSEPGKGEGAGKSKREFDGPLERIRPEKVLLFYISGRKRNPDNTLIETLLYVR